MHTTARLTPTPRIPDHPIDPIFVDRWSPRAFQPVAMPETDLLRILEAARWAPSAYNVQPWRFLYSLRGDAHRPTFLQLLDPFNAGWAHNASALIFLLSDTIMPGSDSRPDKPSRSHSLDAGAAWAHLALQATELGYATHAIGGVHYLNARTALQIPERFRIEMAVAVGKQADATSLPPMLKAREYPSERRPLKESAFQGLFPT